MATTDTAGAACKRTAMDVTHMTAAVHAFQSDTRTVVAAGSTGGVAADTGSVSPGATIGTGCTARTYQHVCMAQQFQASTRTITGGNAARAALP